MRFLCLHGMGTNSQVHNNSIFGCPSGLGKFLTVSVIPPTQGTWHSNDYVNALSWLPTSRQFEAPLRYELGDQYTYDFVEGAVTCLIAPGIKSLFSALDKYCMYYDFFDTSSIRTAIDDLDKYIAIEGPFNAVLAFSMGAALASTLMIQKALEDLLGSKSVFKYAIFVSGAQPFDYTALTRGEIRLINEATNGVVINVPIANIWGSTDTEWPGAGVELKKLCGSCGRKKIVHEGGHEMPGGLKEILAGMADVVRGTIEDALLH